MSSWTYKQKIMRMKNKLKGTQIYIEYDLTEVELKVQG